MIIVPKNVRNRLRTEIYKQFKAGQALTKKGQGHYYQREHGNRANYHAIWSIGSKNSLLESCNRVAKYMKNLGYKAKTAFTKDVWQAVFNAEKSDGLSNGTMAQDLRLANHYMIGTGQNNKNYNRKDFGIGSRSSEIAKQRYKPLTSKEWEERNPHSYELHKDQIEFIRAVGLRRNELRGFKLYDTENGLVALTIGKNGKIRFAEVREGLENEVIRISHAENVPKISNETKNQILNNKNYAKAQIENEGQSVHMPKNVPTHIHRAYYAQQFIKEHVNNDYADMTYTSRKGVEHNGQEEYTIGEYKAPYGAYMELSESLGHNRLEVLKNYLGAGR